jgi:pentatricopeptide repeat protein
MRFKLATLMFATVGLLSSQERFDLKVRTFFFAGFAGDTASLEKGMKMCEDALAENPKNAEALVWHGSGTYYQAGQAFRGGDMQKGMELFQHGVKEMDDAVALSPDAIGVRIPRGAVLLTGTRQMSAEMARPLIEKAVEDYEHAYQIQGPDLSQLGTHPRGELLIGLADGYSRLGNVEKARQWFERIQKELPGTPYAKSAALWLDAKSLTPAQSGCLGCHAGK